MAPQLPIVINIIPRKPFTNNHLMRSCSILRQCVPLNIIEYSIKNQVETIISWKFWINYYAIYSVYSNLAEMAVLWVSRKLIAKLIGFLASKNAKTNFCHFCLNYVMFIFENNNYFIFIFGFYVKKYTKKTPRNAGP